MSNKHAIEPKYPSPRHVSKGAQDFLGQPIDMTRAYQDAPKTIEAWEEKIAAEEAPFIPLAEKMVAEAPVLVTKREMAGVTVREIVHKDETMRRDGVVIYFHGGAYIKMGGDFSVVPPLGMAIAGYHVISVDYRMPPRNPYPAALDDGLSVYECVIKKYEAERMVVAGESAGGGLAAAVVLAARDRGMPLPMAVALNTPWSDLDKIGDSYFSNDEVDPSLPSYEILRNSARIYADGVNLKDPMLSPVYGDYAKGFPPTLLISGTRDLLLSCSVRLHRALRKAGVEAELHVFEAMWHSFTMVAPEEAGEALSETIAFIRRHLERSRISES